MDTVIMDRVIGEYIRAYPEEEYGSILEMDGRYEVFYHLSGMRRGLFNWYTFREGASLLEIGGEFGALTGLLCERCAYVTVTEVSPQRAESLMERHKKRDNLRVCTGKAEEMDFQGEFDYIVLAGGLEWCAQGSGSRCSYVKYLKKIISFLKPEGKLLAAVENRYGLRYLCGEEEPHTQRAYDGLKRYPEGTTGYSFSRQELADVLHRAGFAYLKFYYPLPDYKLPQLIYTDEYLPRPGLRERLRPYYHNKENMAAEELTLYDDVVENGVFPFVANSFLVECGREETFCPVIYSAVTADRKRERACITSIYQDKTVRKSAFYPEGRAGIKGVEENLKCLEKHGIRTVPYRMEGECLKMPFINAPLLSAYLGEHMGDEPGLLEAVFERLYGLILRSSELVRDEKNVFLEQENRKLPWGPILRRAYIEMIPMNCFYADGELLFFDQEFVRCNYPAKYVLYRALRNTYLFLPQAEQACPLSRMKKTYEMEELWEIFEKADDCFLEEVRDTRSYRYFYEWTRKGARYMKKYKVGYMAGVYDLFHVGHLNLINRARKQCDYLIVGVLTDELVMRFKKKLPCVPLEERMAIVEAIKGVDRVVPVTYENIGKMESWRLYHYDCQFSGSDYEFAPDWLRDKKRLEEVGSTIEFLPYTQGTSSTQIKRLITGKIRGKRLFIFGAGAVGKRFLRFYRESGMEEQWDLLGILDNDPNKDMTLLDRNIVYHADYLRELTDKAEITVVIAAKAVDEIRKQLYDMGVRDVLAYYDMPGWPGEEA